MVSFLLPLKELRRLTIAKQDRKNFNSINRRHLCLPKKYKNGGNKHELVGTLYCGNYFRNGLYG